MRPNSICSISSVSLVIIVGIFISSTFGDQVKNPGSSASTVEETQVVPSFEKTEASSVQSVVPDDLDTASSILGSFGNRIRHGFHGRHYYGGIGRLKFYAGVRRNFGHYDHYRHGHYVPRVYATHYGYYYHPIHRHFGHGHHHGHHHHGGHHGHFGHGYGHGHGHGNFGR